MVKRIIWSKNALQDRILILEYWHKETGSKTYSKKLDKNLRVSVKLLRNFPKLGKKYEDSQLRYLIKDSYQIFYKFTNNEIQILHIWDSRRNPEDLQIEV